MINRVGAATAYGDYSQVPRLRARHTGDAELQKQYAEGSTDKLLLANLALNKNLDQEAAQLLFDRDIPRVTRLLEQQGFEKGNVFTRIFK